MRGKKSKRTVEKGRSKQKDLAKSLVDLRVELTRTQKALTKAKSRGDRWKQEAKAQRKSASRALARVEKLRQNVSKSRAPRQPVRPVSPVEPTSARRAGADVAAVDAVTVPDETWSVVRLRDEARSRGLTGMSHKTKAQLLAALS